MTDAHFHRNVYDTFLVCEGREFRFLGYHPWQAADLADPAGAVAGLAARLTEDPTLGVGEIGLDRLRTKAVPEIQRTTFRAQLELAAAFDRPVVLHGAKCWGEVYQACQPHRGRIPAFLFHGFSRATGLLPGIFALNGFVSLGPALLNDHAVNYRAMAKELPLDRVLLESDRDPAEAEGQEALIAALVARLAALRGLEPQAVAAAVAANAVRFVEPLV